ncbi:MAG: DUF3990 domain-containing protein [Eggerthellaceae bacterium]|nr:DUF3990 domain-containing protein [Eggerthellaceae bacterium]
MEFRYREDMALVLDLLQCGKKSFADQLGISRMTLDRWLLGKTDPDWVALDRFYGFAYANKIALNSIKAQLYREELDKADKTLLFHGSKAGIEGPLSVGRSRSNNDFGMGFYCGESLAQSAMFVAGFQSPSLYMLALDEGDLRKLEFSVDQEWMLAVAAFRGRLGEFGHHPVVEDIQRRVSEADIVIAPIADNRMYETIDQFIDGEITHLQCQHSLSATNLGRQYVFVSEKSLGSVEILERCFLCKKELEQFELTRQSETEVGRAKAKVARRQYRNQGLYIEELLS